MRPLFITLEGGEGSGKSTQLTMLGEAFSTAKIPFITTREPGGEEGAEQIRTLLVTGEKNRWDAMAETLLFAAARTQHVERKIKPALAEGKLVLCDRFVDSTRVYQGLGKNIVRETIDALHELSVGGFMPDLTFILDIDPEMGLKRAGARAGDETRFEGMDLEFHRKVREGFLAIARAEPARCQIVDASGPAQQVHEKIWQKIIATGKIAA